MRTYPVHHLVSVATVLVAVAFPILVPATSSVPPAAAAAKEDEDQDVIVLCPFQVSAGFGATPGGAQDIGYFRMGAGRGEIPHPEAITAEGLFSEHDLPLELRDGGDALFIVQTAAVAARFEVLPEVRYLAQLGFSSGLRPDTWRRAPLHLVAVVDKSGSMSGEPLALVRASLLGALGHLRDGDQLSIVLYGDTSHVHLEPTPVQPSTRGAIARRIREIESAGSTSMEAGLTLGYRVARDSTKNFSGSTRVMLFTDERPNVGNTVAGGFMGMAEAASRDGIGLTTIGVGVQFGAELATKISSVRGGNLFFFEDGAAMKRTFASDFDTMVTELAHEFTVRLSPAPGLRIAGVFGVPGEMLRWKGDALVLDVASIFLSRRQGAIYFALAPVEAGADLPARAFDPGAAVAQVSLGYTGAGDGRRVTSLDECRLLPATHDQVGLHRGTRLVDEYLTLKRVAALHHVNNDQEGAFQLSQGLLNRLATSRDRALADEVRLVSELHTTLAFLSGHAGEAQSGGGRESASPLVGVWRRSREDAAPATGVSEFFVIWPNSVIDYVRADAVSGGSTREETFVLPGKLPRRPRGSVPLNPADRDRLGRMRYEVSGDTLTLTISDWQGGPATFVLTRCAYAEIEAGASCEAGELDIETLTGLPTASQVPERAG